MKNEAVKYAEKTSRYFSTDFSLAMIADRGHIDVQELNIDEAAKWFGEGEVQNIARPTHATVVKMVAERLRIEIPPAMPESETRNGVKLCWGDQLLVAEAGPTPKSLPFILYLITCIPDPGAV